MFGPAGPPTIALCGNPTKPMHCGRPGRADAFGAYLNISGEKDSLDIVIPAKAATPLFVLFY
jgi:hypothetical protein